jgi:glycosyl transferase family 25
MSKNEIGCTLSHLQAYEKFLHSGEDACIILEDDVIGSDDDVEQALLIASRFIDESIVLLGGLQGLRNKRYVIGEQVNNHERLYKISKLSKRFLARTCCYTITKKTAAILLDKQHTMMLRADDWQRLLSDTKKIYYADLFSHPIEKESSNIEISRKSLKPGFLGQLIKDGLVYTIQSQLLKLLITTLPSKKKVPIKYI